MQLSSRLEEWVEGLEPKGSGLLVVPPVSVFVGLIVSLSHLTYVALSADALSLLVIYSDRHG